jgi:mannose-1-phosphate guanylyltransferase
MRALLLAAGMGSRLKPITNQIPKCLVPIKGVPLLEIWIHSLIEAGINSILVNTHYLSDCVEEFLLTGDFINYVETVYEPSLLGTAGTLVKNINFFQKEDGMLIHADNYCLADLREFQLAHKMRPKHCLMSMMTFRTKTPLSCGIIELDEDGVVIKMHEKVIDPPGNLANGAVYILSAQMMQIIEEEFPLANEFTTEVLSHFMGRIYAYETSEVFIDIGSPSAYELANNL